jgi:hypothetical protein
MANKPKFGDKQKVKGPVLKRTQRRVRRLIGAKKMPKGVSPKGGLSGAEARAIKKAHAQLKNGQPKSGFNQGVSDRANQRAQAIPTIPGLDYSDDKFSRPEARRIKQSYVKHGRPQPYDPLAELSGRTFADEQKAAEQYEFGDERRALDREGQRLEQQEANTGTYYDDYRAALSRAVGGVRDAADSTAAAQQSAVDTAATQDSERTAQRDAEEAAVAAKFGRPATPSQAGQQAVEARKFMGQAEASRMRERGLERVAEAQLNEPQALLSKAQAIARENARQRKNAEDKQGLERRAGAFRTKYRADVRSGEREWEAIKKEFKLKSGESKVDQKLKKQELKVEKLKSFNQLKQAMLYAGADNKMAGAIVKQAQMARDAKIITAKEYRAIANINKSASDRRADANENVANTHAGSGGKAGTAKPQGWESDRVDRAYMALRRAEGAGALGDADRNGQMYTKFLRRMRKAGIEPRFARQAWERYWKKRKAASRGGGQPGAPKGGARRN